MKLKKIITIALLVSLSIVLNELFSIDIPPTNKPIVRLSFGIIPLFLIGICYGPVYGSIAGLFIDLLGFLIFGMAKGYAFNIGFTLNSILTGLIPGLIFMLFKKIKPGFQKTIIILSLIGILSGCIFLTFNVDKIESVTISLTAKYIVMGIEILSVLSVILYVLFSKKMYSYYYVVLSYILFSYIITLFLTPLWINILYGTNYFLMWPIRLLYIPIQILIWSSITITLLYILKKANIVEVQDA